MDNDKSNVLKWVVGGFFVVILISIIVNSIPGNSDDGATTYNYESTIYKKEPKKADLTYINLTTTLKNLNDVYNERGAWVDDIDLFEKASKLISDNQNNKADSIHEIVKNISEKLPIVQKKRLPMIRRNYANDLKRKMWEHDVDVTISANNKILTFIGGIFAANKNIKNFHIESVITFERLRFDQIRYKWYKGDEEYTYYKLDTPPDVDLY